MANYCPECGVNIEGNFKFCPNCGIDLTGVKKEDIKPVKKIKSSPKKSVNPQATKKQNQVKTLDTKTALIVILGALLLAAIILILSGQFNSPEPTVVSNVNSQTSTQNQSPAVDLNAVNKINELEDQVKANPKDINLVLQLAHAQNDAGFYDKAIKNYLEYLKSNPSDADARIDMGVCYYSLKDYKNAITEMKEALKYKPNHQIGHLNLGIVNLAAGNLEESKKWLQKAVDIDPNSEVGKRAKELLQSH